MNAQLDLLKSNLSEIQITYRNKVRASDRPKITSSKDAEEAFRAIWSHKMEHVEEFMVLYLNRANRLIGWTLISTGGISGTIADPKVIMQGALKTNSSSIIMAHNHPSGNIKPSDSDIKLTNKLRSAGSMLDMSVLDHLILTTDSYFSFADEGKL